MKRDTLTPDGQEQLFELLSRGFEIYNTFSPGPEGEKTLLKMRDEISRRMKDGDLPDTPFTVTVPLQLAGYLMAASKHLGDQCLAIKTMSDDGILFQKGRS